MQVLEDRVCSFLVCGISSAVNITYEYYITLCYVTCMQALEDGVRSFVVSGIFSPVNSSQEEAVGKLVEQVARDWVQQKGAFPSPSAAVPSLRFCSFPIRLNPRRCELH